MLNYPPGSDEDAIMEAALEAGAEDVVVNDDSSIDVTTPWEELMNVKEAMVAAGHEPENTDVTMQASISVDLGLDDAEKIITLVDRLEDLDDVQKVYSNAEFSDEVMTQLG
jgi:transcriptional/translational regulatory protein YebC/TACO1